MKYLKAFLHWCLCAALILLVGIVMLSGVAVLIPLAGALTFVWYFAGWLGVFMLFTKNKLRGDTDCGWLTLFRWNMLKNGCGGGPVYLAETICILGMGLLLKITMKDAPKNPEPDEVLLLKGPSK